MSLLPQKTINTIRSLSDMTVEHFGFECELFIPKPEVIEQREGLDIYQETPELTNEKFYNAIKTKVFIEWKPDTKRLRRLGVFIEDNLPVIAWFRNIPELTRNSWIRIGLNISDNQWGTDEFELTDCIVRHMYNAVAVQAWVIAPRRRK